MGRYDFVSPGAEVVGGLTKLLAERKAEERQQLMDSLAVKADERAATEMQMRQQEAVQRQKIQEAQLASQQQNDEVQRYGLLAGNLDVGASADTLRPEDQELVGKYGGWNTATPAPQDLSAVGDAASASDAVGSIQAPQRTFVGTREQRERERKRKNSGALLAKLAQDPRHADKMEIVQMAAEQNDGIIPDSMLALFMPPKKIKALSYRNPNQLIDVGEVDANTEIVNIPHPPDYGSNRREWSKVGQTVDGRTIYSDSHGNEKIGDVAGRIPGDSDTLGIRAGTKELHLDSIADLQETGGSWFPWDDDPAIEPGRLQAFRQTAANMIEEARTTGPVKALASLYVRDINAYENAVKTMPALSDAEESDLSVLTNQIAGPDVRPLLKKYPVKDTNSGKLTVTPKADSRPLTGLEEVMLRKQ